MAETRHVAVERMRLKFAAAHMATFGGELEPLHGHNYLVRCRVEGALTDDEWVIDFGLLKRAVRDVCDELDHHFLLQRDSKLLEIEEGASSWKVRFGERGYVFPRADVVALPIGNTTAELVAEYIANRALEALAGHDDLRLTRIEVEVEEMPGQAGGYARDLG